MSSNTTTANQGRQLHLPHPSAQQTATQAVTSPLFQQHQFLKDITSCNNHPGQAVSSATPICTSSFICFSCHRICRVECHRGCHTSLQRKNPQDIHQCPFRGDRTHRRFYDDIAASTCSLWGTMDLQMHPANFTRPGSPFDTRNIP